MKIAGALLGLVILAAVFVVWFRAYRAIRGDDGPLFSMGNRKPAREKDSLDAFIAAYKRGEVNPGTGNAPAAKPVTAIGSTPVAVAAASAAVASATPARRDAFVSGPTKLAYLACKTGLRDHHIFAHVQLSALASGGALDPALTRAGVDLLICNASMSVVAAIDLLESENASANPAKAEHLRMLGIRYLRLSAKTLPRPDELHALLYKM